jgi:hypothetical protein
MICEMCGKCFVRALFAYVLMILDQRAASDMPCPSGQTMETSTANAGLRYGERGIGATIVMTRRVGTPNLMYGMLFITLPWNTLYSTQNEEGAILIEI